MTTMEVAQYGLCSHVDIENAAEKMRPCLAVAALRRWRVVLPVALLFPPVSHPRPPGLASVLPLPFCEPETRAFRG